MLTRPVFAAYGKCMRLQRAKTILVTVGTVVLTITSSAWADYPTIDKGAACSVRVHTDAFSAHLDTYLPRRGTGVWANVRSEDGPGFPSDTSSKTYTTLRSYGGRIRVNFYQDNYPTNTTLLIRHGDYMETVAKWTTTVLGVPTGHRQCAARVVLR